VSAVWQTIQTEARSARPHAYSCGRQAICVRDMREDILAHELLGSTPVHTFGCPTTPVPKLPEVIQRSGVRKSSPIDALEAQVAHVSNMREDVFQQKSTCESRVRSPGTTDSLPMLAVWERVLEQVSRGATHAQCARESHDMQYRCTFQTGCTDLRFFGVNIELFRT